jgi:hypothetical protein
MIVADMSVHHRGLEWPFFGAEQTSERPGDDRSEWLFVAGSTHSPNLPESCH